MTTTIDAPVRNSINIHGAMEGDILVAKWGYDQTNWDYYEVEAVTAKTVTLLDLKWHKVYKGKRTQTGYYANTPGRYAVHIDEVRYAYFNPDDPHAVKAKQSEKDYWSVNVGH